MPFGTIASAGASQGGIGTAIITATFQTNNTQNTVQYANGFWFGGGTIFVYKSDVKATWTTASYAGTSSNNAKASYWNGYYFLPTGPSDGTWRYSTDLSVTPTNGTTLGGSRITSMCYFQSNYYLFEYNQGNMYYSSSISGTWTTGTIPIDCLYAATDGTTMVIVGVGGRMRYTTNGTTWNTITSPFGANNIEFIMYDPESTYWVACGALGTAAYSADGISSWTLITTGLSALRNAAINKCNGRFIISQGTSSTARFSKSASSLPSSAFTAQSAITITGGGESVVLATDGNHVLTSLGTISAYSR